MTSPPIDRRASLRRALPLVVACLLAGGGGSVASAAAQAPASIRLSTVTSNGITMRIAEQGDGPLVLLLHGFPELWYSWRNQIPALAAAGYHAVAPDMRGFGGTDAPAQIEAYNALDLCADVVGLVDLFGQRQAVLVAHDWGAATAWRCTLLYPDRFRALVAMSVPWGARGSRPPLTALREAYRGRYFYMLYFQEPGVAEAELDADPRKTLGRLFTSPDTPLAPSEAGSNPPVDVGLLPRLGQPLERPDWLSAEDLDYFVSEYERTGFHGGLNYYRNLDRNWELTADIAGRKVEVPVLFIAGDHDLVIRGQTRERLRERMAPVVPGLRDVVLLPDTGHWLQQEEAARVNALILGFLRSLDR